MSDRGGQERHAAVARPAESVRELVGTALSMPAESLEIVVRVSPTGWSHRVPALRHFAYRGRELVASVKQVPKHRQPDVASVRACYQRFTNRPSFTVPRLLGTAEDAEHFYFVEEAVRAPSLASLVASRALEPAAAAAVLEAVLLDLWALADEVDATCLRHSADALLAAAGAVFGADPMYALAAAAVAELERAHRDELRTVLTTHDITAANVLRDADGHIWLTDFDLAGETAFFGLDYVRAWLLSAPLQPPQSMPRFTSPGAYRLYRALYPIFEYQLQAPHLAPPQREVLRRYAQDLFIRLALPEYHARATFEPVHSVEHPPHAQLFFAGDREVFSESESLRFPFDVDNGRLAVAPVIRTEYPIRYLRLDPIDTEHTVVVLRAFTVRRGAGTDAVTFDLTARCVTAPDGNGIDLVNVMTVPGSPGAFWSANADPQIIVDLGTNAPGPYAVELALEVVRDWKRQPAFDPSTLMAPLHTRLAELSGALDDAAGRAAELRYEHRCALRAVRLAEADIPAAAGATGARHSGGLEAMRAAVPSARTLVRRVARIIIGGARRVVAGAIAALRGSSQPMAAPLAPAEVDGVWVAYTATGGRPWPAPHISLLVACDTLPTLAEGDLLAWLDAQTCHSVEVIAWSSGAGQAWEIRRPQAVWQARSWDDLRRTLAGRYLIAASPDLLARPATYLEFNLLALETEALAVTINAGDDAERARASLAGGCGPAGAEQVVRVECAAPDLSLDIAGCMGADRRATVIGKVLSDAVVAAELSAPPVAGLRLDAVGPHLIARRDGGPLRGPIAHAVRAADAVLDLPPSPSALPTVLVVFPYLAVGGAERVALDLMRLLRERLRFVVVTTDPHDARLGTTTAAFRALTPYVYPAPEFLLAPLTFSLFAYLIRRFAPHTLYVANGSAWIYDALPTLKQHYPHLRTLNQVYDHHAGWIERYEPALLGALDGHIGCNRRICAAVRERGAAEETVHLIHNGIDAVEYDPARYSAEARRALRERFGLPVDRSVVTFASRLHQQKRPMDFVELARQFGDEASVVFFLVGDGPLGEVVREQVERLGLRNLVQHPFYQPSRDLFAIANVLVLPSEYEGMPMVILEALAMGTPVVATDVGNNREVLERTGGGLVAKVGDVGALRRAVQQLLTAPPDPAALRAAVQREFGLAAMTETYYHVLTGTHVRGGDRSER